MDRASAFVMDGILSTVDGRKSIAADAEYSKLPYMDTLAERIKARRDRLGGDPLYSQAWLARQVKVTPQSVCQWENGTTRSLKGDNLIRAARALQTTEDWLDTGRDHRCDSIGDVKRGAHTQPAPEPYPDDILEIVAGLQALPVRLRRQIGEIVARLAPWDGDPVNERRRTPRA